MDRIFIKDLHARGIIGVNDWERKKLQDILINIVIHTDIRKAGETDDIEDSVDYRAVGKKVLAHTESVNRFTVEALANDIASMILEEKNVAQVHVRVEKPGALRFSQSVGVEIVRKK